MRDFGLFAVFASFFLFFFILGIAVYVLAALGLYTMAKNRNIENAWVAWIPIAQLYILGRIIRTLKIFEYEVPQVELVLPGLAIAGAVLGVIPLIGQLIALAAFIVNLFALHKLYSMYRPDQAVMYLILSVVLPFMGAVFIFIMRNDKPVEEWAREA